MSEATCQCKGDCERHGGCFAIRDEGVHWTCYCADQPRCCELEGACCVGCEDERDYRTVNDYEEGE